MKHLIRAITEWFEADSERIRENTRIAEAGTYMRGVMDGREDVMDTFGLEVTYLGSEEDDE